MPPNTEKAEKEHSLAKQLEQIATTYRPVIIQIGSAIQSLSSIAPLVSQAILQTKSVMDEISKSLVPVITQAYRGYQERLKIYPDFPKRADHLASQGWFITLDFSLSDLDLIATSSHTNDEGELENQVAKIYRDSFNDISQTLLANHPERQLILKQAISAHQRGDFALSVPVFFSQADGICSEKAKKYLFQGATKGPNHISSLAEEEISKVEAMQLESGITLSSLISLAMWNPLKEQLPIGYNEPRREKEEYSGLNRHQVLHGESIDYPTEINSLKAFSLLCHVSSLLRDRSENCQE